MRVKSFGMFWRSDQIDWSPGKGTKDAFRLLGRIGSNRGSIRVADFRRQQGIYVLFNDYGPNYVGLTRKQGLGKRLKDHLSDKHEDNWDRFCWFGFEPLGDPADDGIQRIIETVEEVTESTGTSIGELEALLIRLMNTRNNNNAMKFQEAEQWKQISFDDAEKYIDRLS